MRRAGRRPVAVDESCREASGRPSAAPDDEELGWLLPELFAVTLELSACVALVQEPCRSRIAEAVGRVDRIIATARTNGWSP